jgi:serine/threonine protein kinase
MRCFRNSCARPPNSNEVCPHCRSEYCSETCRVRDWKESHQFSCAEYVGFKVEDLEEISDATMRILGKGSYGEVVLYKHRQTATLYAVKVISKEFIRKHSSVSVLIREIQVHKSLRHPNIIQLVKYFEDDEKVFIVLEYASRGSLFRLVRRQKGLDEPTAWKYFSQTCLGIKYLHDKEIIHRDLKPENILIDKYDRVKICDFGWCVQGSEVRTTFCGTLEYMAPEMLLNEGHSYQVDLWALGILLYELLHGRAPFQSGGDAEKRQQILRNELTFNPVVSGLARDLIQKLLRTNPKERISLDKILAHPWIEKYMDGKEIEEGTIINHPEFEMGEVVECKGLVCKVKFRDRICVLAAADAVGMVDNEDKPRVTISEIENEAFESLEKWLNQPKKSVEVDREVDREVEWKEKEEEEKVEEKESIDKSENWKKDEKMVWEKRVVVKKNSLEVVKKMESEMLEKREEFGGVFSEMYEMETIKENIEKRQQRMRAGMSGKIRVPKEGKNKDLYTKDSSSFQTVFSITNRIDISERAFESKKEELEVIRKTLEMTNRKKELNNETGFWAGLFGCLDR